MAAGLLLLEWVANAGVPRGDTSAIAAAQAHKAQLQAAVAEMQANHDAWAKTGMLAQLERCGPKARPSIRVDERTGAFGNGGDYRVILGY